MSRKRFGMPIKSGCKNNSMKSGTQREKPKTSKKTNSTVVLQNLLYINPVLNWVPETSAQVNILVIGNDAYAEKFVDLCLQTIQIPKYRLDVTVAGNNPQAEKEAYLRHRPAIEKFVNMNRSLKDSDKTTYADLEFIEAAGIIRSASKQIEAKRMTNELLIKKDFHYVFISWGDDASNHTIAKNIINISKNLGMNCSVNFVVESTEKTYRKGNPVRVNELFAEKAIHPDLYRMAFNVFLSWYDSSNVDIRFLKKEFLKKYNYESSIAFALAVLYKLRSLGIDERENKIAAELFSKAIENKTLLKLMIACEHRRWIMEKIVNGWDALMDKNDEIEYKSCAQRGEINDPVIKTLHPCIVRNAIKMPLQEDKYKERNHAKWNKEKTDKSLDQLDYMSLELHKCFSRDAERLKEQQLLNNGDMEIVKQKIMNADEQVVATFNQFMLCQKNIMAGNQGYARQYGYYEKSFMETLKLLPKELKKEIEYRIKHIRKAFYPAIESSLYRDYRAYDEVVAKKIPFILTHVTEPCLTMAFDDGRMNNDRTEIVFGNVASATVINPKKINYLYCFDEYSNTNLLIQRIDAVLDYFDSRKMKPQICFSIVVKNSHFEKGVLLSEFEKIGSRGRFNYSIIECKNDQEAIDALLQKLNTKRVDLYDGSTMLFSSRLNNAIFTGRIVDQFPYFEFDIAGKQFKNCKNCDYLYHINNSSFIRVEDIFMLKNRKNTTSYFPEFGDDYKTIWNIYTGNYQKGGEQEKFRNSIRHWNDLCNELRGYVDEDRILAKIKIYENKKRSIKHLTYFFPNYAYKTVNILLEKMVKYKVISEKSMVAGYASDTCCVEIYTEWDIERIMERLFSKQLPLLADYRFINVKKNEKGVEIIYDSLTVDNLKLKHCDEQTYEILDRMSQCGFINMLEYEKNNNGVSFVYSSQRIKNMMRTAGKILEIYCYYEILKTGYFDDAASGYEFFWNSDDVKNELDCILTKDFRSVFIECKALKQIGQDAYHKLNNLANRFGIGCKKVLISNNHNYSECSDPGKDSQRIRGAEMGVITVSNPDDILDIGETLKKIMEGTYPDNGKVYLEKEKDNESVHGDYELLKEKLEENNLKLRKCG